MNREIIRLFGAFPFSAIREMTEERLGGSHYAGVCEKASPPGDNECRRELDGGL